MAEYTPIDPFITYLQNHSTQEPLVHGSQKFNVAPGNAAQLCDKGNFFALLSAAARWLIPLCTHCLLYQPDVHILREYTAKGFPAVYQINSSKNLPT